MWILKWKHTRRAEKFLSLEKNSMYYLYSIKAVQIFLFLSAGCDYTYQSPCPASQTLAELIKDLNTCKHNLQLRVEHKQICTLLLLTHKKHQTCDQDHIWVNAKNSKTQRICSPSFLPRPAIPYNLPAISATSLTRESAHVLLLANIALKREITLSCFTQDWLNWTYLAL